MSRSRRRASTTTCSAASTMPTSTGSRWSTRDRRQTTYRDLLARIDAFAGALAARGIGVGDVVALQSPNSPASRSLSTASCAPGRPPPPSTRSSPPRNRQAAGRLEGHDASHRVGAAAQALEAPRPSVSADAVVVLDGDGRGTTDIPCRDLLPGPPAPEVSLRPGDAPRGAAVLLGHDRQAQGRDAHPPQPGGQRRADPLADGIVADDVVLAVLPFFHIYGMTVLLNVALHARAQLVTMPSFDLDEFLRIIPIHQCTFVFIAPPIAVALAKHPLGRQLRPVERACRPVGCRPAGRGPRPGRRGAARLPGGAGLRDDRAQPRLPRHPFRLRPRHRSSRRSSVGLAVANTEFKSSIPPRARRSTFPRGLTAPGELWVKGPKSWSATSATRRPPRRPSTTTASCTPATSSGRPRRRRLRRRPAQGADQVQGLPGAARRARGRAAHAPPHRRCRRHPPPDQEGDEIPQAFVVSAGRGADGGRGDGLRRRAGRAPQEGAQVDFIDGSRSRRRARSCARTCASAELRSGLRCARLPVAQGGTDHGYQDQPGQPEQRVGRRIDLRVLNSPTTN